MVNFNLARWLVDMGKGLLLGCGTECVPLGKSLICWWLQSLMNLAEDLSMIDPPARQPSFLDIRDLIFMNMYLDWYPDKLNVDDFWLGFTFLTLCSYLYHVIENRSVSFLREKCTHVMGMLTEKLINAPRFNGFLFCDATSHGLLKLLSHHVHLCLFNFVCIFNKLLPESDTSTSFLGTFITMGSAFFTSRIGEQDKHRIRTQENFVFAQCVLAFRNQTTTEPEISSFIVGNTYVCWILLGHLGFHLRKKCAQPYREQDWLEDLVRTSCALSLLRIFLSLITACHSQRWFCSECRSRGMAERSCVGLFQGFRTLVEQ